MYEYGNGVQRDLVKEAGVYRVAAEKGLADAQLELGYLYNTGKGVRKDDFEAAKWFLRSAEQRHPIAQTALGFMYHQGTGVRRDYRQAAEWFRRAAEQNCSQAQFNLGVLCETGSGVPLNHSEAYKWFTLATPGGYADSRRAREALTKIMTEPQLRDGKASVSDWVLHHNNPALTTLKAEPGEQDSYTAAVRR